MSRGDRGAASNLAFAEFIDRVSADFRSTGVYRRALLAKAPGSKARRDVCPPEHPHGATGHCYNVHRCACTDCRTAASRRYKVARDRRVERNGLRTA